MATYSKEWIEQEGLKIKPDFSIEREFQKLKEGGKIEIRCDGFGITAVLDIDEECFVIINGEQKSYEKLTKKIIEKKVKYPFWFWILVVVALWGTTWILIECALDGDDRGVFGDMFGSINALFSGLAFGGIIYTISLQKKELKLQRKELKQTRKEFETQNETLKLQRFENQFFQMINLHHEIIDKLEHTPLRTDWEKYMTSGFDSLNHSDPKPLYKRGVLKGAALCLNSAIEEKIKDFLEYKDIVQYITTEQINKSDVWAMINKAHDSYFIRSEYKSKLSHYFRNLYHIFKFIYQSDITDAQKQHYAAMLRAQLSPDELFLIFYNGMIVDCGNPKFLFLIQHFDITKNLDHSLIDKFDLHHEINQELRKKVTDQLSILDPVTVLPDFEATNQ